MALWTFEQASKFCHDLHEYLVPFGYDVGLAGGILFRAKSDKDIDVIIYPLKRKSADFISMYQALPIFGLKFNRLPNSNIGYKDDGKHVEVWEFGDKRVDLFFLT